MRLVPLRNVRETHELLSVWLLKQDMNKNSTERHTKMERDITGALNPRLRTTGDDGILAWGGGVISLPREDAPNVGYSVPCGQS